MDQQSKPPKILYHYTSQAGLLGIIQDRQIWATNVLFLNDSTEVSYAIQLVQENINRFCKERELKQEEIRFLEDFGRKLGVFHDPGYQKYSGIYTCSFSENGDQLSQWRGYCPNNNGFSIGFEFDLASSLSFIIENQYFELVRCEYDENKQAEIIDIFLLEILVNFRINKNKTWLDLQVWDDFLALAPRLKHPKFEEEKEWRLISKPTPITLGVDFNPSIDFRIGNSMLVPYMKINLVEYNPKTKKPLKYIACIPEIYIGPTLYPDLSHISLSGLLLKENVHVEVEVNGAVKESRSKVFKSKVPYRI